MKIRLFFVAVLAVLLSGLAFATSYNVVVGTNSVVVVPDYKYTTTNTWATGTTYSQGAYITASNSKLYWTPDGGTSTNEPSHRRGITEGADGVQWYYLTTARNGVELMQNTSGRVYLNRSGLDAEANGIFLLTPGHYAEWDNYRGEVNAITTNSTVTLGVQIF